MSTLVMIFLKAPRPGTVKTRLGREIGMTAAVAAYRELAEQQLQRIPAGFRTEVHYAPRGSRAEMRAWLGSKVNFRAQCGGDLGARLRQAFTHGFARGYRRIMAIGSDCPELDATCLRQADTLLEQTDVVLGPATDGGYYLIGLRRVAPRLFADIAWSTETVCATTLTRAQECGLTHALLAEKDDIDDLASALPVRDRRVHPVEENVGASPWTWAHSVAVHTVVAGWKACQANQ
jgi:rSAM/selenodomain-associated transferase 1